jgi:hypothetical protein
MKRSAEKALRFFVDNPRHRSLRTKKMEGQRDLEGRDIWEARLSRGYRFTFALDGDTAILYRIGPHDIERLHAEYRPLLYRIQQGEKQKGEGGHPHTPQHRKHQAKEPLGFKVPEKGNAFDVRASVQAMEPRSRRPLQRAGIPTVISAPE